MDGRVSCSDVVRCAFDLSEQDVRMYGLLNDLGPSRAEDLAREAGREGSVVYRNLQKLVECGLVEKRKHVPSGGGYRYVYHPLPRHEVKARLRACVDDWYGQMARAIDRL